MTRVFYAANGAGDIIETYRQWRRGQDDKKEVSVTFSGQLYDACRALGLQLYAISPHARREKIQEGDVQIEHRPRPEIWSRGGGWYFLAEGWHTVGIICTCLLLNENIAVVEDCALWPLWIIGCCFGVRIVAVLHCALWPAGFRPMDLKARLLQRLTGWFWEHCVDASLVVSPECARQIRMIAPRLDTPVVVGLGHFRETFFAAIPPPPAERHPFRVMYAGRIERNKGVFDLVRIAAILERETPGGFCWEICGTGAAEEELRKCVESEGLAAAISLLGKLDQDKMGEAYGRSHAIIAPTTSHFAEGLVKTASEAALAGRPLVTSRLCHGLDLLAEAVVEVPPEDIQAYVEAIRRLADDPVLYEAKRLACANAAKPFLDEEQSWGRKLRLILQEMLQERSDP